MFSKAAYSTTMQCHWSIVIFIESIHSNACKTGVEGVEDGGGDIVSVAFTVIV